jgi:hypothetical protein
MLPLLVAAIIALVVGYFVSWQGLFINLFTTFIGILLTVFYVDIILREHDQHRWSTVTTKVNQRIVPFANRIISEFGSMFVSAKAPMYQTSEVLSGDEVRTEREVIRAAKFLLIPALPAAIEKMDQSNWKALMNTLSTIYREADELIDRFQSKMTPELLSAVLEIQDQIDNVSARYSLVPDILGVSDQELRMRNKAANQIGLKHFFNKETSGNMITIINSAATLLEILTAA